MKKRILCFGDSNTHGYDAENFGRLTEDERWTGLLSTYLGNDYAVIEEGLGGRTTVFDDPLTEGLSGLSYLTPCMMTHRPIDLLIIMLGTNDTKERFHATAENITNGLKRLVTKALTTDAWSSHGPNILIISPSPIEEEYEISMFGGEMGRGCSEKSYNLAPLYENLAQSLDCHFLDAGKITSVHHNDYMHIDKSSHQAIATAIATHMDEYIK